jgi:hypothetical protein
MTLWTNKTGLQGALGVKCNRCFWMPEGRTLLQLDPVDHHFDPEGQAPTLWASTSWSTGSEGRALSAVWFVEREGLCIRVRRGGLL